MMLAILDELRSVQHKRLNTIPSKLIYMIIRNHRNLDGWTTISLGDLSDMTGLSITGVKKILAKLVSVSLIEKDMAKARPTDTNRYRALEL